VQLDALNARFGKSGFGVEGLTPGAVLFLLTGIPKLLRLEEGVGVSTTHAEVVRAFEAYLRTVEPVERPRTKNPRKTSRSV
jgi:TetR/AcrR family transcriptional regulator, transcriptional repressor for nem operon